MNPVQFPLNPVRAVGRTTRAPRGTSSVHHAGGTRGCGRQDWTTRRREAGRRHLRPLFAARPANCWPLVLEACAGRRIRRLCPPAVACSAGYVCLLLAFAMPTALLMFLPPFCSFCLLPVHSMCARIDVAPVCKLQELSCWQLQHGPAVAARAPVHLTC